MRLLRFLWRLLRVVLLFFAALWFLIEELGWHPLAAWVGRFADWPPWARTEARIAALPPRRALLLFLVPIVLLFPVKLLALEMMHRGRPILGVAVIVAAKLLGTAIGGRLYLLMRKQLRKIRRFSRFLARWRLTRITVKRTFAASSRWRQFRVWRQRLRARFR